MSKENNSNGWIYRNQKRLRVACYILLTMRLYNAMSSNVMLATSTAGDAFATTKLKMKTLVQAS